MTSIIFPEVSPTFSDITLRDDDEVSLALNHILKLRNREDKEETLLRAISEDGHSTVGHLRLLSDQEWKALSVPAICRIYLKHLVRKAGREKGSALSFGPVSSSQRPDSKRDPFIRQLEIEFNSGKPFMMDAFRANLDNLTAMGFTTNQAMEALCICNNRSVENALELCVASPALRSEKRKAAIEALAGGAMSITAGGEGKEVGESKVAPELAHVAGGHELLMQQYMGYLRGLTANDKVTLPEMAKLKHFRDESKISDEMHSSALLSIGLTEKQFDSMKNTAEKSDRECVVCLDNPKEFVVLDCMHLCLCEECMELYQAEKEPRCPMCSKPANKFLRIYT
eukprot:gb/GEZN01011584.1/.p1 GENE.gb/GEZN01011584.1/~~gb/GEZN01011584.1/.p1  ORF type:complete len:340 (-),score=47.69 gb/GEZN01011584.1/:101-1120(-)